METPLLITGATGHVGGALARLLSDAGVPARALVRRAAAALPPGIEPVAGDLADPASLTEALRDVDRVFLVWPFGEPGPAEAVVPVIGAAANRIVYLSSRGARDDADADPITRMHGVVERLLRERAREWTFLRSGGMATNTLGWAPMVHDGREVRWPYGASARPLVHEADLAEVALRALTTDDLVGASPELTGPTVLTQEEQVAAIGDAIGTPVRWVELSRAEARGQMRGWGWPDATVDGALDAWAAMVDQPETVTDGVASVLGRPARSFEEWVRDHAGEFGWSVG
ncbi:NAD(P)H-binding protein [Nocardioides sp.]|uniref:NAD(P)H-binding protein n=1 Tax=Nocardioides sp. TaxID=35761 RepID=UPI002724EBA8|nr:NAD(P)H-binding protein [Nocardioides sp.]MDO9455004.1 NAD(P)H-binding protein [Nocardioides sp.]